MCHHSSCHTVNQKQDLDESSNFIQQSALHLLEHTKHNKLFVNHWIMRTSRTHVTAVILLIYMIENHIYIYKNWESPPPWKGSHRSFKLSSAICGQPQDLSDSSTTVHGSTQPRIQWTHWRCEDTYSRGDSVDFGGGGLGIDSCQPCFHLHTYNKRGGSFGGVVCLKHPIRPLTLFPFCNFYWLRHIG